MLGRQQQYQLAESMQLKALHPDYAAQSPTPWTLAAHQEDHFEVCELLDVQGRHAGVPVCGGAQGLASDAIFHRIKRLPDVSGDHTRAAHAH